MAREAAGRGRQAAALFGLGCALLMATAVARASAAPRSRDARIVAPSPLTDADGDRISDALAHKLDEQALAFGPSAGEAPLDLIVALDRPPALSDAARMAAIGGQVVQGWDELVYAIRVRIPARAVAALASLPGVVLVEENAEMRGVLHLSTRQVRARPLWSPPHSIEGDAQHNIAVLDSGIDGSHPDLAGKVAAWRDEIGPLSSSPSPGHYTSPIDKKGHGSHVAGIAAGGGAAAGMAVGGGVLNITDSYAFPQAAFSGYVSFFPIDTTGASGPSSIVSRLRWADGATSSGTVYVRQYSDADSVLGTASASNTSLQPLTLTYSSLASGLSSSGYYHVAYKSWGGSSPYWLQSSSPMRAVGDGFNLMRGVAPGADLVGVKVLDDYGSGTVASAISGLTWVVTNRAAHSIVVANLSFGTDAIIASLDTAVNSAVAAGVVVVCAAGNGRGGSYPYVGSPGSASRAITVAAISEEDRIASYSSHGATGEGKPDIAAPGGSAVTWREIVSVDSNDGDFIRGVSSPWNELNPDQFPDDYGAMHGTSMACPHVAGAAALVASALGVWSWDGDEALRVKLLLLMTATETGLGAEAPPDPTLDRGGRDVSEGYGRLNIDAAVEAVTMRYTPGAAAGASLGSGLADRKCWARYVNLAADTPYSFTLHNPAGGDFDLYLYHNAYVDDDSVSLGCGGDPIVAAASTTAGLGGTEMVSYTPASPGTFYLVVKRVAGDGAFTLSSGISVLSVSVTPADWNLGTVEAGAVETTWTPAAPAQGGHFTAANEGTGAGDFWIRAHNTDAWGAASAPAHDVYSLRWGQTSTQGSEPSYTPIGTDGVSLVAGLPAGASFPFDLLLMAPTSSSSSEEQRIVAVVEAYQP